MDNSVQVSDHCAFDDQRRASGCDVETYRRVAEATSDQPFYGGYVLI